MQSLDTNTPPAHRAFDTASAATYIGHSEHFLKKARRGMTDVAGPRFRRIGNRVIYTREDLDAWIDGFPVIESYSLKVAK